MAGATDDELAYWVAFSRVSGIGPMRVQALLNQFGTLRAAWAADEWTLASVAELDRRSLEKLIETRRTLKPDVELARLQAAKVQVLTWNDPDYPRLLREITGPPPVLYLRGSLLPDDELAVAIVGTRRMTPYGEAVVRKVVSEVAAAGVTIVSGLALGVDALAHECALQAGGRTIAVLGSGVDQLYPARNRGLARRIMEQGGVVSDYPLGTPPEAANFPPRNRIISGLSRGTVVIEADERSGALITAAFATDQGREVMAVPGSILATGCRGTNRLIRDGATPVLGAEDILQALNLQDANPQREVRAALPADPTELRVLTALGDEPIHADDLGSRLGMTASDLGGLLTIMELKGMVRRVGAMSYVRV